MTTTKLVSNGAVHCHDDLICQLLQNCDEAVLVSPFLFPSFDAWLGGLDLARLNKLTLITTLAPRGDDQLKKPSSLLSFHDGMSERWPSVSLTIQVDNSLHGKVYLFSSGGVITDGVISSANLTRSGLRNNHEWGLHITDAELLSQVSSEVSSAVEYPYISADLLRTMQSFVDQFRRDNPEIEENKNINAALENALKKAPRLSAEIGEINWEVITNIFFKPWGTKDDPLLKSDQRSFGDVRGDLDFPKGKPSDVMADDLVVCFGTGSRCVVSVYRVLSFPQERSQILQERDPHAKRWPWYVHGQNLTPGFGDEWWEHDVTVDKLVEEFLTDHTGAEITAAGGASLGAMQFGAGRLNLSRGFGQYVVDRLMDLERSISHSEADKHEVLGR